MKTNVKNGVFMMGFIPVATAQIKISDAGTDAQPFIFETGADGLYAVLGHTDENGIVQEITIDVGEHARFVNHKEVEIKDSDILVKDGKEFEPEEDKPDM